MKIRRLLPFVVVVGVVGAGALSEAVSSSDDQQRLAPAPTLVQVRGLRSLLSTSH
jgi:hypothetical protein